MSPQENGSKQRQDLRMKKTIVIGLNSCNPKPLSPPQTKEAG
jgi:hypothetical protein